MSTNPILDIYVMAYSAGVLKYPIYKILEMPSRDGKSLTSFRFALLPDVIHIAGDTTTQALRKRLHKLYTQQKVEKLNLIIVEDASKIRYKVREDFFALIAQFSTGTVNVEQTGMDFTFKTHASVIINTPPFFRKNLESSLLNAGSGDRFDLIKTELSDREKNRLNILGIHNMPNKIRSVTLPEINKTVSFPKYVFQHQDKYNLNIITCMYACFCAGIDENLVLNIHNKEIKKIDWTGFWEDQTTPPEWHKLIFKKEQGGEHR